MTNIVHHVTNKDDFDSKLNESESLVLVDFYADWCNPCKQLMPTVEKIANKYAGKLKVLKVNVDDCPDIASSHAVRGIPTLILFKNAEPVGSKVGSTAEAELDSFIQHNI